MSLTVKQQQKNLLVERLIKAQSRALQPPPDLSLSQWAEEYFHLSPESSSLPGRFRFDRAAFQREVFDTLSDPNIKKVVVCSASQLLKTQSMLCFIGYAIHLDPGPMLVVQPTSKMAQSFSKDRVDTMLRDVPILKGRVKDKRQRDSENTIFHKRFPAGHLTIATAGSPSDLASRPIRYLLLDEVDRYGPCADEGDPVSIARARTSTFWNSKEVMVSSPTFEDTSRIWNEYKDSDRRIYTVPCNECGVMQQLVWAGVKWNDNDPRTAHYECQHCHAKWDDNQKNLNVRHGKWVVTNPDSPVAGFHISAIYSSFKSLSDLVFQFLRSKEDPEQLKAFTNTMLAEVWRTNAHTVKDITWLNRLETYDANTVPNQVGLITAGVDTQQDRLEVEIVGWGVGDESWSLDYIVIHGNTNNPAPWEQLAQLLEKPYTRKDGLKMRINAMCIDAGGTAPAEVFSFARRYANRNIFAIKGMAGEGRMIFPKRYSRWKGGQRYWQIGVDVAKERIYNHLAIQEHGPGYCHFPTDRDDLYFQGLVSEQYEIKYRRGRPYRVWTLKSGVRNEPLDCRCYAVAARFSFNLDMKKRLESLDKKAQQIALETPQQEEEPQPEVSTTPPKTLVKSQPIRPPRRHGGMSDFINSL